MHELNRHGKGASGFTVLEVLVALTIFSMISLTIFAIFRAAIRSQATADREVEMIRRARFAVDSLERDLSAVYFREETAYNQAISRLIEQMEQERIRAEETNEWTDFHARYGDPNDPKSAREAAIGNPYEKGRIIDLQFEGKDGGKLDSISFAMRRPLEEGRPYMPFGLSRVRYFVDKGWLIRAEEPVEVEARDQYGNPNAAKRPPIYMRLAEGVEEFELQYSFWFDNQWYEIGSWNSTMRQIRNAKYLMGDYRSNWEEERRSEGATDGGTGRPARAGMRFGDPGWNEFLNDQWSEPHDKMPATVRVMLTITDPENPQRRRVYRRIIRILPAEESYQPTTELSDDERDNEKNMRDQAYRMIFPGVMDKY